jgi:glycosyltransferase involved in cell wall biosynthesis
MNIWIFNHYAITPAYPGGTRHFELGRSLAARGHRVALFASNFIHMNFNHVPLDNGKDYKIEEFENLRFIWVKTRAYRRNNLDRFRNMLDYSGGIRRVSRELEGAGVLEKPDIIIGSTVHPFAAQAASKMAVRRRVPFIYEIRDLWPQSFIDMGIWSPGGWQSRLFRNIEARTVGRADRIIALSPRTAAYLGEAYKYPSGDIAYIPNGVYTGEDRAEIAGTAGAGGTLEALRRIKADGRFLVLFSGSLIATNKLDTIIEAAERLKNSADRIAVALIGKGQEEDRYRVLIEKKKLENITIHPPVKKEQVAAMLREADTLILNQGNVQWGSSNKLYDYMASGRPIISGVHAKHNDIVSEIGGGQSVPPENPEALADAVSRMEQMNAGEREEMGRRNMEYVKKHHDWEVLSQRLLELVENLHKPEEKRK